MLYDVDKDEFVYVAHSQATAKTVRESGDLVVSTYPQVLLHVPVHSTRWGWLYHYYYWWPGSTRGTISHDFPPTMPDMRIALCPVAS